MIELHRGCCLDVMPRIPDASIDAVITDPPYPEISRPYGRMTEADWHVMMRSVVAECRRILKPSGSAVFILQPNSRKVGSMRLWLWEFMVWAGREWNLVQDVYWWNTAAMPRCGQVRSRVLPRPSVKPCVWLGEPDCFRDIDQVLNPLSDWIKGATDRDKRISRPPSGWRGTVKPRFHRREVMIRRALERNGVTPFNILPIRNAVAPGLNGHGAGTPEPLCDWWTRYISPPDGVVCDPFMGSGTTGLAALKRGRSFVGIERDAGYFATAKMRIEQVEAAEPLFA